MPVLSEGGWNIDYIEAGKGPPVLLIHSSVSGNQQWRSLTEALKDRHRVLAVNLFGYGDTTPWPENAVQTLADHSDLVLALCSNSRGPVFIVGHSFGGSVALKAALRLGHKVAGLVLLGRNSFLRIGESHGFSKSLVRLFLTKLKKLISPHFKEHYSGNKTRIIRRKTDSKRLGSNDPETVSSAEYFPCHAACR